MAKDKPITFGRLLFGIFLSMLILIALVVLGGFVKTFIIQDSEINIECSFNDIEYVNVWPGKCWNEDINYRFCPLPKDVSCKGYMKGVPDKIILEILV